MKLDSTRVLRRLLVFFVSPRDGVPDKYISLLLQDLRSCCEKTLIVCGAPLGDEGQQALSALSDELLCLDGQTRMVCAYRAALEHIGAEEASSFDEIVFTGDSLMGPVRPFSDVFKEMDGRDLDFLFLCPVFAAQEDPQTYLIYDIQEHIRVDFFAMRRSVFQALSFSQVFHEIPVRDEAGGPYEEYLTRNLSRAGLKSSCLVDVEGLRATVYDPMLFSPLDLVEKHRCPVFLRQVFVMSRALLHSFADRSQSWELLTWLREKKLYDTQLIWDSLLRHEHMADIKNALKLTFILSSDRTEHERRPGFGVALVLHLYYPDLIDYCYRYALSMPADCDVYITVPSEELGRAAEAVFRQGPWKTVTYASTFSPCAAPCFRPFH